MTNEEIKKILDGAPDGATHIGFYDKGYFEYWRVSSITDDEEYQCFDRGMWVDQEYWYGHHNLTDLREILELRQEVAAKAAEVERLKVEAIKLLDAAICPCCDKSGAYYDNYGELCQCQWCDEVKKLRERGDE